MPKTVPLVTANAQRSPSSPKKDPAFDPPPHLSTPPPIGPEKEGGRLSGWPHAVRDATHSSSVTLDPDLETFCMLSCSAVSMREGSCWQKLVSSVQSTCSPRLQLAEKRENSQVVSRLPGQ
ncbi:hypothetical protein SKAU_G00426690 [Synaphobranchus kaupii]|uniref:Uncharacterized protein n=1 Tax=Synaphobranchus kaupii TaxID=118154 RepID=A0A9Q1E4Y2_SYNKA|nr:hypothetical protein SKAU_G00426690 [Synaphobranchus kaupii]